MLRALPVGVYLLLLVVLVTGNIYVYGEILAPRTFNVTALDLGKGSAVLVRAPSGATVLVDAGPDAAVVRALGTALPFSRRHIDVVVLTSAVASTTGGLPAVMSRYRVSALVRLGAPGSKSVEAALAVAASAEPDLQQITYDAGARVVLGRDTFLDVLPTGVFLSEGTTVTKIR